MGFLLCQNKIDNAVNEYYRLKKTEYGYYIFEESELNKLALNYFLNIICLMRLYEYLR
jgi:hypothetical protein